MRTVVVLPLLLLSACSVGAATTLTQIDEARHELASPDPFAALPWRVAPPEGMELLDASSAGVSFGAPASPDGTREALATARHIATIDVRPGENDEARVERAARAWEERQAWPPRASRATRIDGRAAWEIFADAPAADGARHFVYHVIVAGEGYDVAFSGDTGAEHEDVWLARFRISASSWEPKPVANPK